MKKGMLIKLLVIGIVSVSLIGCGKDKSATANEEAKAETIEEAKQEVVEAQEESIEADVADEETADGVGMGNPVIEYEDDVEIYEMAYGLVTPYGAEDVKYFVIGDTLFERQFTIDGTQFVARVEKGDKYEDISGMYYEWDILDEQIINSYCTGEFAACSADDEMIQLVTWFDEKKKVNYSVAAIDEDLDGFDITAYVMQMYGEGDRMEAADNGIPGVPSNEILEESFESFITWAALQSFYDGIQFEELSDDIAVAMAAFTAQTNDEDIQLSEDGCSQIISKEKLMNAMFDLFGRVYEPTENSSEVMMYSHLAILDDGSIDVGLGDWGEVGPLFEIVAIDKVNGTDAKFYVSGRYYPYVYGEDKESDTIPSYVCSFVCVPDDYSRYGFIIAEMSASIVE